MSQTRSIFSLSLLLTVAVSPVSVAADYLTTSPVSLPPQDQLLPHLKTGHPRLLTSENELADLRKRVDTEPVLKQWRSDLENRARKIIDSPPSKYEIPDGLRLLATSRRVLDRMYTLALLYHLNPANTASADPLNSTNLAQRAWLELSAAANFPDWNPRHFLDTAEMCHAFAIAYDWLYQAWTPEQRQVLKEAMVTKAFNPALKVYQGRGGWPRARHNWNQVCNGGIGIGALALGDVEPQLCSELLHDALESIPLAMAEFAPDGAWKEGPGYWNYATTYNVAFLAALDSALGTDFGLSQIAGFRDTGLFPPYLTGPFERTFNYADGGDRAIRAAQMFWFARKFNQPLYAWYEQQLASPAPLDLLWFTPVGKDPKSLDLPLDKCFRGAEVVTLRSEWENPKALFVAFKAGDNKANHSHLDLGCFVLDALGVRWAVDLGADDYNLPGYFGSKRWDYYRLRAEGQNTILVNPGAGPDQDPTAATRIVRFESKPQRAFALADLSPAYAKSAEKTLRGVALLNRQQVLIQDEIKAANPAEAWWFMHTRAGLKIENDGRTAILHELGAELRAELLSPRGAKFEIKDPVPLPNSPHPERQAKNEGIKKLTVHVAGVNDTRIAVLFTPVSQGAQTIAHPAVMPLDKW